MKILALIAFILLGLNILRFAVSAVVIIFTGKVAGAKEPMKKYARFWNLVEVAFISWAYWLAIQAFYFHGD